MIKRIDIKNFGSFSEFEWNTSLFKNNNVFEFKKLNIIYGRNYSGKTTLSRIFRSFEVRKLPENYPNPQFEIITSDNSTLTQQDTTNHLLEIRVYNTDFVKENLSFLTNENEGEITPFAIIGGDNKRIEERIKEIDDELGDAAIEAGKRYELHQIQLKYSKEFEEFNNAKEELENQLRRHANDNIKPNRVYGESTYNINSIKDDIRTILGENLNILKDSEVDQMTKLLLETPLPSINQNVSIIPKFKTFFDETKDILSKQIKSSKSIQYLVNNALLETWVRKGMDIQRGADICGFCGQDLPEDIWRKLDAHFSKESKDLEGRIYTQIELIKNEIKFGDEFYIPEKDQFYESTRSEFQDAIENLRNTLSSYKTENQNLLNALKSRQNEIFRPITPPTCKDYSEEIRKRISAINKIIRRNNQKTNTLSEDQKKARRQLRLNDVLNFITINNLDNRKQEISDLGTKSEATKKLKLEFETHVKQLENKRNHLVSQLLDEKRGADQVNKYLNHSLGIDSLQLVAMEDESQARYKFQIMRGEQPAYNMSEGERSLVSFCYFLAKL